MAKGQSWSPDEDARLLDLIEQGVPRYRLFIHFPDRTGNAVESRAYTLCPPMGLSMEERSEALRDAINALIDRMPAHDVAEMIGKPHLKIPGTERVYRGQAAERLAA